MAQAHSVSSILTKPEAAAKARIHLRSLERRIEDGSGPRLTRIGRRVLIREDHLAEWLDRCTGAAKQTTPMRSIRATVSCEGGDCKLPRTDPLLRHRIGASGR
jgi:hypothetical protein